MLELRGVSKRFGAVWAVRGANLSVSAGETVALWGPSGCGKTTLLRLVAGLEAPDEGEIRIDGAPGNRTPPWERNAGMVFQGLALWPHMSVRQHLEFALEARLRDRGARAERIRRTLAMVRLEGKAERYPAELSGGEQQRVAFARAVAARPKLLLLDEPFSSLDGPLKSGLIEDLARLRAELGATVLLATHDREETALLAGRVYTDWDAATSTQH